MGRSVSIVRNSYGVAYYDLSDWHEDDYDNWDDFKLMLIEQLQAKYPSLEVVEDSWDSNEVKLLVQNSQVYICISEYCGLASLSIAPLRNFNTAGEENLAIAATERMAVWLMNNMGELTRVGGMSDGTSVFEKKAI